MAGDEKGPTCKIFGYVLQPGGDTGIAGAVVRIYHQVGDTWQRLATRATDARGYWECEAPNEALQAIRISEENPPDCGDAGWPHVPLGALVRGLNAVHWPRPDLTRGGPVIFYDLSFRLIADLCRKPGLP